MSKCKFYALCQYKDKKDKILKIGFLPKEGYTVPNDLGLELAIYSSMERDLSCHENKVWHVTDVRSGLEVGNGETKKKAIESAIARLSQVDPDKIDEMREKVREQYGITPGYKITYL